MNEVEPNDTTDFAARPPLALTIGALSVLHFLCCGIPLLLAAGVPLATVLPWEYVGGAVVVGASFLIFRGVRAGLPGGAGPIQDGCCAIEADGRVPGRFHSVQATP